MRFANYYNDNFTLAKKGWVKSVTLVILSRKGFDGKAGGKPSPVYEGRFRSFPIPFANSGVFYRDMKFNKTHSYLDVMMDLGITQYSECHLDPDLHKEVLIRDSDWEPIFGQSGGQETSLQKERVGEGDIFLFFGWFKHVSFSDGRFQYEQRFSGDDGFHAIYGYLEVGETVDLRQGDRIPSYAKQHPHVLESSRRTGSNRLYIAKRAGTFRFNQELVLTRDEKTRSCWRLPPFFESIGIDKFRQKTTRTDGEGLCVNFTGRGSQELLIEKHPDLVDWSERFIKLYGIPSKI
ncbi:hypothetical protein [Guptibacillus spartinae]|uniref:Nmad3 family putative nucleotide modification protein n=1 Tax=Guptibacillus spartinae TaxID=3025679 RepID=UPI00236106CB|nr:hypothetical protein [Pseudalkalibacillus spartinae]